MANGFRAFTIAYKGKALVLKSKVNIGIAFNPPPPPYFPLNGFEAIWDTGASGSVISANAINKCGLKPIGMVKVYTASGENFCHSYLISIHFPQKVVFPSVHVTEGKIKGADILIGMDIIGMGDFAVTNHKGKTVFSYRVPSTSRIDFVAQAKKLNSKDIGRNDPCPCGSGKKI